MGYCKGADSTVHTCVQVPKLANWPLFLAALPDSLLMRGKEVLPELRALRLRRGTYICPAKGPSCWLQLPVRLVVLDGICPCPVFNKDLQGLFYSLYYTIL